MKLISVLAALLLGLGLGNTLCAAEQGAGPVTIEADQLELNQQSGVSIYQGNVRMQQQTMLLLAERLELHSDQGQVIYAYADGSPAELEHEDPQTGKVTRARALRIEYRFSDGLLELKDDAYLWHAGDEFSGKHLIYESDQQVVRAFGDKQQEGDGRVKVILQPQKESSSE
ncbi:MAG: lipopolysaccharide transport periplasmic protein LptA [Gammaproteobacteria bacterium]|nr:lipopolysaccharide transport periplasmic protein LptA [Gammaproteobacteria bacterium]MCW8841249.1 lipopolysaccharide transport periplasmic protein LptA [Gammaproteobacteria bacterium]MCW8928110.1 lipopolysaccharide transport periplasmic protein LptA [Gammaproteobacteria bacterium]MCW8958174.1 lipopolysaccharide transport periplasmic protein LptA [Gammaproteobacteria bacterium]MCW8973243.1 lipopolysaccharide transport periplasmic protein LptA [Gammaproteobacteria bacterium]